MANQLIGKLLDTAVLINVNYLTFRYQMHSYDLDSRQKVFISIASPQDRFYLRLTFTAKQERCPDLKLLIVWRSFVQNKHLEVRHKR